MERRVLSTSDIATELGLSIATVCRYCREGRIPGVKIGRSWFIYENKWLEFLDHRAKVEKMPPGRDLEQTTPAITELPQFAFVMLTESDVEYDLKNLYRPDRLEKSAIARYVRTELGQSVGEKIQTVLEQTFSLLVGRENKANNQEQRLVDYLNKRYRRKWQVQTLAVEYQMSREQVTRKYRRQALQLYRDTLIELLG